MLSTNGLSFLIISLSMLLHIIFAAPLKETPVPLKGNSLRKVTSELFYMKRLPYIHRATHLAISHDEKNFVVTQADPFARLLLILLFMP